MKANHIFIFCENHDEVADELIHFGFIEGSSRTHLNQGTRNRKFYFIDFYIEILWVHNFEEITNQVTSPTKLYERSKHLENQYSPFGLCIDYSKEDDKLFKDCFTYKPDYLPKDMTIEVLTNEESKTLPWVFRWKVDSIQVETNEPINFPNKSLLKTIFGVKKDYVKNNFLDVVREDEIVFRYSKSEYLKLIFNNDVDKTIQIFNTLPLIIEF